MLNSTFFDTLREDYEGIAFDNWFKKKARNKEKAYIFKNESGLLQGFLYLKDEYEDEPDYLKVTPPLTPKRRMKVGTFKIEQTGFRLGERFLKIIKQLRTVHVRYGLLRRRFCPQRYVGRACENFSVRAV